MDYFYLASKNNSKIIQTFLTPYIQFFTNIYSITENFSLNVEILE